ncbi:hypothetical protein [Streptomyces pseudogriseolus]|uniref:hypothetical protein n=1 Tax=Streptomyces pseudogriseolus TaxID=36817 RepID=UPI00131A05A1|nr:hypothetical protein [Streptomyces gancidicus]
MPTRQGYEMTAAAAHAREAGHPPAGLTLPDRRRRPLPGMVDRTGARSRAASWVAAGVVTVLAVTLVVLVGQEDDEEPVRPSLCGRGFPVKHTC